MNYFAPLISRLQCFSFLCILFPACADAGEPPVSTLLQPPQFQIGNEFIRVHYDAVAGTWGISGSTPGDGRIADNVLSVQFSQGQVRASENCRRQAKREEGTDGLGKFTRLTVTHRGLPHVAELSWSATVRPGMPYAIVRASAQLDRNAPGQVRAFSLIDSRGKKHLAFGTAPAGWMCFRDSGMQGGTGVLPFFSAAQAKQVSPATLAVYDPAAGKTLLLGWTSWVASNPRIELSASKADGLAALDARCDFYCDPSPATIATEPLLVGFNADPLARLEQYAREVREANHPPLRTGTVMGWLSWYCAHLDMTEEFVLENAKIVAERYRVYGIDTMQVDHGWQYRDLLGNWTANDKFPRGMKWLGGELEKRGLKLGIWMALNRVSEAAPFFAAHPEATLHGEDGKPKAARWAHPPHGKMYNLDPTHPAAQAHYRDSLAGLMDAGCRYYKIDYIRGADDLQVAFHAPHRPRGIPMARYEMEQIRAAIGPDSWLRYCSSATNTYCGLVNIGGATRDVMNAGNWKTNTIYHQQLGSCWYKHRNFWLNEPDALIVGEGAPGEARMRCAWLAMSGGTVALGDDLTKIPADRMAMIPTCLPSYDVAARPLDLFEHVPSRVWDLPIRKADDDYHAVALFNLETESREIAIPLKALRMTESDCAAWEFWTQTPLQPVDGAIRVSVPPRDSRVVVVRHAQPHPQVLATNMHLTMGGVELSHVRWDEVAAMLSGIAERAPSATGRIFLRVPEPWRIIRGATALSPHIATVDLTFAEKQVRWNVQFDKAGLKDEAVK